MNVIPRCPACRSELSPGANFCRRCGASVRASCPNCGEPIEPEYPFCPGCGAYVAGVGFEAPPLDDLEPAPAIPPPPPPATASVPGVADDVERRRARPARRRRRRPWLRRSLAVLALAVLALAGLEAWSTLRRPIEEGAPVSEAPAEVSLVDARFSEAGFQIAYPDGWTVRRRDVGGRGVTSFTDPRVRTGAGRGLYVLPEDIALADARGVAQEVAAQTEGYARIGVREDTTLAGQNAFVHEFTAQGSFFEQWWVESGGRVFRLTFFAPEADATEAAELHERILSSFRSI